MSHLRRATVFFSLVFAALVSAQQQCYFGPGAENRGPTNLVPCNGTGTSACCLLGDICLSGNACWNYATGDTYQYGCTDVNYKDEACPYKCGWDAGKSPWTGLEYCDEQDVADTWICHSPESCGCEWNSTYDLLVLEPRGCKAMGSQARVALNAPSTLAPYVSLPTKVGGSTGYFSQTVISGSSTWVSTVIPGYTPDSFTQFTTYKAAPTSKVVVNPGETPDASTNAPATSPASTSAQPSETGETSQAATGTAASGAASSGSGSSATPVSSSSGLSTGAKAGIGVAAAIGGLLLIGAIVWFCIARRRYLLRQGKLPQPQHPPPGPQYQQVPAMQPQYPQGAPMQGSTFTPYPMGQFQDTSGIKPGYSSGPIIPSPPMAPTELSAEEPRDPIEMDSEVSVGSPPMSTVSPRHPSPGPGSPVSQR